MVIIPEIETVVILVPRTGSGSLRRMIADTYPKSMLIYRHMEADGIPHGYDRWRKVGVVRHPVDRLWSLYKFLRAMVDKHDQAYIEAQRTSVDRSFSDWVVNNDLPFTGPYDNAGHGRFWPVHNVRHFLPENRKSQHVYLRPDLGTNIFHFENRSGLCAELGLEDRHHENATSHQPSSPGLSHEAHDHVSRFFGWDLAAIGGPAVRCAA